MKKLLHYFLLASIACSSVPVAAEDEPVTLYGVKTYCDSGGYSGIYSVTASQGAQPELYWADGDMIGSGGAVYAEGTFYVLTYIDFFGTLGWLYQICDPVAKTYDYTMPENLTFKDVGSAMTYDPSTGKIYSICIDATDTEKVTLSTMDPATAVKTPVAPIERLYTMASTASGTIYGVAGDGNLYTVNKNTGELTLVGPTGIIPNNNQSAVIDYKTNIMYWSAYTEEGGALYTVDITTGKAELLSKYTDNYQLVGLYIEQTTRAATAPAPPTDITAEFANGSKEGTVSFIMPNEDIEGTELSGNLSYEIRLDEETLTSGESTPGKTVKATVTSPRTGLCNFIVHVTGDGGAARPEGVSLWVGPDTPQAVTECTATLEDGIVKLSWSLPEKGVNGGYVDPAQTRYILVRGPYEEKISDNFEGTHYEEAAPTEGVNPLMYMVTPTHAGLNGESIISNTVISGEYMIPPFAEDLTDPFRSLVFTTEDANNDDCCWRYDLDKEMMKCDWAIEETSDDWFITAPVMLEAGKYYNVAVTARSEGRWNYEEQRDEDVYTGYLDLCIGKTPSAAAMTTTLVEPVEIYKIEPETIQSEAFTVNETGTYHIGLHHSGTRSIYYTYVSRLEVNLKDPDSVTDINDAAKLSVSLSGQVLSIDNPSMEQVTVAAVDGRVMAVVTDERAYVRLSSGVYIVAAGSRTFKIAVR